MKIGYLDCFSGISGDMLLGAFLDAGWNERELLELPKLFGFDHVKIDIKSVKVNQIVATKVEIKCPKAPHPHRNLHDITNLIERCHIDQDTKKKVACAFKRLAEVEARIHGTCPEEIHFHETGGVDAIIDITGCFIAKKSLGIDRLFCSELPLSRGLVECEHGVLPLPAPATLELLKGKKVCFVDEEKELVTPTGALLAVELADVWGALPDIEISKVGYGAGTWKLATRPNLLRLILGKKRNRGWMHDEVMEIKTVIDDMNPELIGYFLGRIFSKGAIDAWLNPVFMKKNRPGVELTVLSPVEKYQYISQFILTNTTSSGLRIEKKGRIVLERKPVQVITKWGKIGAKAIKRPDGTVDIVPEFEECKRLSEKKDVPISEIYKEVALAGCRMKSDDKEKKDGQWGP